MAKKKWKQFLGLTLSAVMMIGMSGCGSSKQEETKQSSPVQENSSVQQTSEVASLPSQTEEEVAEIVYPLDSDYKFTLWSLNDLKYQSCYNDASESPFHVGLSENTGVEIEWKFPQDGVGVFEAFSMLMTDEKLPDIIYMSVTPAEAEQYIEDGVFYDLTEYLPKYAPDYWEYINSDAEYVRAVTTASGKHYGLSASVESDYNITYMGTAVRKDWLDECGLDVPETMEDWEEMLVAFKDKYGATFSSRKGAIGLASGTGAYADLSAKLYVDNDEIKLGNATEEYKEYLTILNDWWDRGLIDKDALTNDSQTIRNKCVNNEVGAIYINSGGFRDIIADAEAAGNGAEWIGVSHPRASEGAPTTYIQTRRTPLVPKMAMITTDCPEDQLITALKFLNYGYTEEGFMYWNFGNEGVSYTLNSEGKPEWTDLITKDEAGANVAYKKYVGTASSGITLQASRAIEMLNPGVAGEAIEAWVDNSVAAEGYLPSLSLTIEENQTYTDRWTAIDTYISETCLDFIIGEESLDNYDDYLENLNKMGLEECLKIQQAAYDRYMTK